MNAEADAAGAAPAVPGLNDQQLLRYARHILLDGLGIEAQERFVEAHVLLIGAGGLGCAAGLYLGSAGVGRLTIVDDDEVDLTNLQRQIAHGMRSIGQPKAASLADAVTALNPDTTVRALALRATPELLDGWVAEADVVVDCSDNFMTRHAVNAACVHHGKPLVSGAAIGFDGQLTVVDPRLPETPCYACLFPRGAGAATDADCATLGVFAPLVGVIGSLQACEALKLLAPVGRSLAGRLLLLDARSMEWTELRGRRDPTCAVCAMRPDDGAVQPFHRTSSDLS